MSKASPETTTVTAGLVEAPVGNLGQEVGDFAEMGRSLERVEQLENTLVCPKFVFQVLLIMGCCYFGEIAYL